MGQIKKQLALIAFLGAVVMSVLVLLVVVWKAALVVPNDAASFAQPRSGEERITAVQTAARGAFLPKTASTLSGKSANLSLPNPAPDFGIRPADTGFFEHIAEAAHSRVASAFRQALPSIFGGGVFPESAAPADKALFSLAYPEQYITYLRQMQDMMMWNGALGRSERVAFISENEIVFFLERFVDYLASEHLIDPAKVSSFKRGIAVEMRNINAPEAVRRRLGLSRLPARHMIGELYRVVVPSFAHAQVNDADIPVLPPSAFPDDPRWVNPLTVPGYQRIGPGQCFRQRSNKKEVGFSVFAPCCDCGKTKKGRFVLHCPDSGLGELLDTPASGGLGDFSPTDFQAASQMIEPAFRAGLRDASPDQFLHFLDNVLPGLPDDVVRDVFRQIPREELAQVTQRILPFMGPESAEAVLDVLQLEDRGGYNSVVLGIMARLMPNERIQRVDVADLATITDLPPEIREQLNRMGDESLGTFLNDPQNAEIVRGFSNALTDLSFLRGGGPTEVLRFGTNLIRDFGPAIVRNLPNDIISELDVADLATITDLDPGIRSALNDTGDGVSLRDFLSNPDNNAVFQGVSGALMANAVRAGGAGSVAAVGRYVTGLASGFLPNYTISAMDVSDLLTNPDLPASIRDALAAQNGPLGSVLSSNPVGNNILASFPGANEFLANNPAFATALASVPSLIGVFDGIDGIGEAMDSASGVAQIVARVPEIQAHFADIPNLPGAVMVGTAALDFVLDPGIDTAARLGVSIAVLTGAVGGPVGLAATVAIGLIGGGLGGKTCKVKLGCLNKVCGGSGSAETTADGVVKERGGNAIWDEITGICGCDK